MPFLLGENDKRILNEVINWYRQNKGNLGTIFRRNPRPSGGGGAAANVLRATVIVAPTFQNPTAQDGTPDYAGINYYILRATTSQTWEANHSPAYVLNEAVLDTSDNRVYTMTNAGGISNDELAPHENSTDWTISDEIKVEYASCFFNRTTEVGYAIRDTMPIFQPGDVVRYISYKKLDDSTIYLLDEAVTRIGSIYLRGFGTQIDVNGDLYNVPVYI